MRRASARAAALFCLAFAVFQAALALGAPFGEMVWGGSTRVLPPELRQASAWACVYLVVAAVMMLGRARHWNRGWLRWVFLVANVLVAVQLGLNTIANLLSATPAERYGMGLASLIGCVLAVAALAPEPGKRGV